MSENVNKVNGARSKAKSGILATLFGTAIQALFLTLCLTIVFGLFLSIAFGIFSRTIPELPPGFESLEPNQTEGNNGSYGNSIAGFYKNYKFDVWYGVSFVYLLIGKLGFSSITNHRRPFASGLQRFWKTFRENRFKIVVGNALGCLIVAMVVVVLQQVSLIRLLVDMDSFCNPTCIVRGCRLVFHFQRNHFN